MYKAAAEGSAPGRSKYSDPKARARHAALVRWKKENPQAANVAERLAQIRAARLKKGKKGGKGKGKKPAAPKQTPEQRKQAKLAEQSAAREKTLKETGLAEDARGALDDLASGRGTDDDGGLIKLGLAEEAADGTIRLTAAGRAAHRAAGKGDAAGVKDAISRGTERRAKHVATQQKKAQRAQEKADRAKASREKKRKAGSGQAKEKPAKEPKPDKAATTAKNRKDVTDKMAANDAGITSAGRDALQQLADGGGMDKDIARIQEQMGLVERDSDGKPRATAQGRALLRAIDKGDYGAALDAVSRAKDKVVARQAKNKAKQEKAKPAPRGPGPSPAERGTGPRKPPPKGPQQAHGKQRAAPPPIGRRPQPMERKMAAIDEIVIDLKTLRDELVEDDAIKAGRRNSSNDQAQIDQGYELAMQLCDLFESLGADTGEEEEEVADDEAEGLDEEMSEEGEAPMKAAPTFGGKPRDDLDDADFAGPNRTYPIMTAADVKDAASLIGKAENPDAVKKRIIAIAKRKGFEDALPEAWRESATKKGIELYHTDEGEEAAVLTGYSVKATGDGWTGGYLVKFGGDGDLSHWRDVFDKTTDYGRATKSDVYVHHRMLPGVGKRRLTNQAEIGMDDEGIFIKHLLDLRSAYERKLYGLVETDKLGWSSGTAPHLVERKALGDGRHKIEQWPLGLDASYTPMPAGGFGVEARAGAMKSLFADAGVDLLNAIYDNPEAQDEESERPDGAKALDERARRLLLLELELLDLEAAINE